MRTDLFFFFFFFIKGSFSEIIFLANCYCLRPECPLAQPSSQWLMWVRRNEVKETKWMRLAFKAPKSSKLPTLSQVGRCCRTHDASGRDAECSGLCVLMMCREEEFPTLVSFRLFFSLTKFIKQVCPWEVGDIPIFLFAHVIMVASVINQTEQGHYWTFTLCGKKLKTRWYPTQRVQAPQF